MIFNKKILNIIVITFFLILGIIFRLKAFCFSRPLWLDECLLFHNIYDKNYFDFFSELSYSQSAPPFFLMLEKLVVSFGGISEKALRLVPFLCSIISLPIFYIFSKKFLKSPMTIIAANALFAINIYCIFYAQELKQYSMEILCFIVLFMILNNMSIENFKIKNIIIYFIITVLFPFFTLTSYFLICAWFFRELSMKNNEIKKLIIIQIPMVVLLYFYYKNVLYPQRSNILNISSAFWQQGFLSIDIQNDFLVIKNAILYYFTPCFFYIALIILLLIGICLFIKDYKNKENSFLINILLVIIVASFCKLYPLLERAILFMIPAAIILVTKGLDLVSKDRKILSCIIIIIFILSFHNYNADYFKKCYKVDIWSYISNLWRYSLEKNTYPNSKEALKLLKNNYNTQDIIIINDMSKAEYDYYKIYYNFYPQKEKYTYRINNGKIIDFKEQLDELTENNNYYWLFYYTDFRGNQETTKGMQLFSKQHKILIEKPGLLYLKTEK